MERLAATMRALDPYEVTFVMEGEGLSVAGRYVVSGDRYRITLPEAEVWGEGALRYEVDHPRKTVTLMPVDTAAHNLLDNPTRAFDFVTTAYPARLLVERADEVALELTTATDPLTLVRLTLARPDMRPKQVRYEIDGIGVDLRIERIEPLREVLPTFSPSRYADYEVVDFR